MDEVTGLLPAQDKAVKLTDKIADLWYTKHRDAFDTALAAAADNAMASPSSAVLTDSRCVDQLTRALEIHGPVRLCKYQPSTARNRADIESGRLHLSPLDSLNDPLEGRQRFSNSIMKKSWDEADHKAIARMATDALSRLDLRCNPTPEALDMFVADIIRSSEDNRELVMKSQQVGCLSEDPLNTVMWDRYAGCGTGFAASYRFDRFTVGCVARASDGTLLPMAPGYLIPVCYGKPLDVSDLYPALICGFSCGDPTGIGLVYSIVSLCRKGIPWSCEREWRVVATSARQRNGATWYAVASPDVIYLGHQMEQPERDATIEMAARIGASVCQIVKEGNSFLWAKTVNS